MNVIELLHRVTRSRSVSPTWALARIPTPLPISILGILMSAWPAYTQHHGSSQTARSVDIGVLRWGYKRMREIMRRMKMYRGEVPRGHPPFPQGSPAECKAAEGPVDTDAPDIVYSKEDNDIIDQFHRDNVSTSWHSVRNPCVL